MTSKVRTNANNTLAQGGFTQMMDFWFKIRSKSIHTCIPAKIISVDYKKGFVNVQPLIRTEWRNGVKLDYPEVAEVPVLTPSANRGKAKITMPIKAGDIGILYFSERDTGNYLNSSGTEIVDPSTPESLSSGDFLFPSHFDCEIFTPDVGVEIDPNNIVIENELSTIVLQPDGTITVSNGTATVTLNTSQILASIGGSSVNLTSSSLDANAGGATLNMSGGSILANGATINASGNVITAGGADLQALYDKVNDHRHTLGTGGDGNTGGIL